MDKNMITCPGCGARLPSEDNAMDERYNASKACKKLYDELSAYTLSLQDTYFIHQLLVDTYTAQHAEEHTKPIVISFALITLYLIYEHNYTGKQAQKAHRILANKTKHWPSFSIPKEKVSLTVLDIVKTPNNEKQEKIKEWGRAVWEMWKPEHQYIDELTKKYLDFNKKH